MSSSTVYSAGAGGQCRLGRPVESMNPEALAPAVIESLNGKKILSLCVGWRHNVVILEDGKAYGWGCNGENQFGDVPKEKISLTGTNIPVQIFQELGKLTWVQCGEKHTAILTDKGKVFIVGSAYGKVPVEMKSNLPIVYIACGVGTVYAVNCKGHIFESKFAHGSGTEYVLPEPICDIAAGSSFSIAVSVNGTAYAKGSDAACGCGSVYPNDGYEPIKSLKGIKVARVFAHEMQSIVITRDNRVFVCGNTADGRIGIKESSPQKNINMFVEVEYLRDKNIIEASCGDSHCVFLSKDGKIYGSGANIDFRSFTMKKGVLTTPELYENSNIKFSYVRCGCYHTVAIADPNYSPVHPGLRFFGLLVNKVRVPRYISIDINGEKRAVDVSIGTISMYGVMPGCRVMTVNDSKSYRVIGIDGDMYVVESKGTVRELMRSDFLIQGMNQNEKEENFKYFGLRFGEKVTCIADPGMGEGFAREFREGTIWFKFECGLRRVKEIDIKAIFSTVKPVVTKCTDQEFINKCEIQEIPEEKLWTISSNNNTNRNVILIECSDGIEYPLDLVEDAGYVLTDEQRGGKVIGQIGSYYCVQDVFTREYKLVEIAKTKKVRSNGVLMQGDIYMDPSNSVLTRIINIIHNEDAKTDYMVVLPENKLLLGEQAIVALALSKVEIDAYIVSRLFGKISVNINESTPAMHYYGVLDLPPDTRYYPGDLVYYSVVEVEEKIHCITALYEPMGLNYRAFRTNTNIAFPDYDMDPIVLFRRMCPCQRKIHVEGEGTLSVSIYLDDFKGLRFIPGNELEIDDEKYVVLGTHEQYLYIRNVTDLSIRSFYSKGAMPTGNPNEYKLGKSTIRCKNITDYPQVLLFDI